MKESTNEHLKHLQTQYILEVRKFINALQVNASPKELIAIRKNARQLLYEIRKNSGLQDLEVKPN